TGALPLSYRGAGRRRPASERSERVTRPQAPPRSRPPESNGATRFWRPRRSQIATLETRRGREPLGARPLETWIVDPRGREWASIRGTSYRRSAGYVIAAVSCSFSSTRETPSRIHAAAKSSESGSCCEPALAENIDSYPRG